MDTPRTSTLIELPPDAIVDYLALPLMRCLLEAVPELARRSRYGEYLNDQQAQEATGLKKRQLRYLREVGRIPYRSLGQRTILYKTAELFAAIDEGTVRPPKDAWA